MNKNIMGKTIEAGLNYIETPRKSGGQFLLTQMLLSASSGTNFLGLHMDKVNVLAILSSDNEDMFDSRIASFNNKVAGEISMLVVSKIIGTFKQLIDGAASACVKNHIALCHIDDLLYSFGEVDLGYASKVFEANDVALVVTGRKINNLVCSTYSVLKEMEDGENYTFTTDDQELRLIPAKEDGIIWRSFHEQMVIDGVIGGILNEGDLLPNKHGLFIMNV